MRQLPVSFSEEALTDLEDIFFFLLENGAAVDTGLRFIERIKKKCQKVGHAPHGYPERLGLGMGIRLVPFERSAMIAYRLTEETVEVVRVLYGGRDYDALIVLK